MFQPQPTPAYAGFWIRFLAYLIDSLIMMAIFCPLGMMLGFVIVAAGADENSASSSGLNILSDLVSIVVAWIYWSVLESSSWQATIGKKVLGLKVTDLNGNRIDFGKATGRYFGKILSGLILGIGFIMVAFTERKQGLHDIMASTLVIKGGETQYQPPPPPDFGYGGGTLGLN